MPFQNDDLLLVNRSGESFKTEYGLIKQNILEGVGGAIVSEDEPTDSHEGDLWYQPSTEIFYVYVENENTGVVTSLSVRNGGSGYTSDFTNAETITSNGHGSGLTVNGQAGVGGNYTNPTVNQGGHGYQVGEIIYITGAGHGNGSANVTAVNTVTTGSWEEVGGDGVYLSKITDDTAAGKITFEQGLTSNDRIDIYGDVADASTKLFTVNQNLQPSGSDEVFVVGGRGDVVASNFSAKGSNSDLLGGNSRAGIDIELTGGTKYGRFYVTGGPTRQNIGLEFTTDDVGITNPQPVFKIEPNGAAQFGRGDWSSPEPARVAIKHTTSQSGPGLLLKSEDGGSNSYNTVAFYRQDTPVGTISTTDSETSYNVSSDYRLKENIVELADASTRVKALKPCQFNFKRNPDRICEGFLAHEVQDVVPGAVSGEKDKLTKEGNPQYQMLDHSKLVPLLTKSLQEALSRIEQLETRLAVLEGGN